MNIEKRLFDSSLPKVMKVLERAAKTPYYAKLFSQAGLDLNSEIAYKQFCEIPITEKASYKLNCFDMISTNLLCYDDKNAILKAKTPQERNIILEKNGLFLKLTSGSTGQPMEVIKSEEDNRRDYFALNAYRRKATNYRFTGKYMWIWPANPYIKKFFGISETNCIVPNGNKGYKYFLVEYSEKSMQDLYDAIFFYGCEWLTASPTAIVNLARHIEESDLDIPNLSYIECHSEKLNEWQSDIIHRIFGVKPVSIYSSNEVQFIAGSCEENHMHLFSNNCFVEFIQRPNNSKELVVTSLNYYDIPIIRYRLGDCGDWDQNDTARYCPLSKAPRIVLSGFRTNDLIVTTTGSIFEPFIITDAIYMLSLQTNLKMNKFFVRQVAPDLFEFYFTRADLSLIDSQRTIDFLTNYLLSVIKCSVKVVICSYENIESSTRKYKYFESMVFSNVPGQTCL